MGMKYKGGWWRFLSGTFVALLIAGCSSSDGGGSKTDTEGKSPSNASSVVLSGVISQSALYDKDAELPASIYVVGKPDVVYETDDEGNFTIDFDVTLSSTVVAKPGTGGEGASAKVTTGEYSLIILSKTQNFGRKVDFAATAGDELTVGQVDMSAVGQISGKALLEAQTDHTGVMAYIPGTSFIAMSAADGRFTMGKVPEGVYDFVRAEKDGFHYAVLPDVAVASGTTTTLPDLLLRISTGVEGAVSVSGTPTYTTDPTVQLEVVASGDALLMRISEDSKFVGVPWQPISSYPEYTFQSTGQHTLYVMFADANGLETGPFTYEIYVDTNPKVAAVSPESGVTLDASRPTLRWETLPMAGVTYRLQLADNAEFSMPIIDTTTSAGSYTLTTKSLTDQGRYYWRVAVVEAGGTQWDWAGPWSFRVDLGALQVTGPFGIIDDTRPTIGWTAATLGGVSYKVQIASDYPFTQVVAEASGLTTNSFRPATALANQGTYYVRVAAVDANGVTGRWSTVTLFSIDLGTVFIVSPSGTISNTLPTVTWSQSRVVAARYVLEWSTDATFASAVTRIADIATTSYTLTTPLAPQQGYVVRVAAVDANGVMGNWSAPATFAIDLGGVTFLTPEETTTQTRPTLTWSASTLPGASYDLEIAAGADFATKLESKSGLTTTSYTMGVTLQNRQQVFVRLRVADANGQRGPWSPTAHFTLDLGRVTLISPTTTIADTTPQMKWTSTTVAGASYTLEVATDEAFSNKVEGATGLTSPDYTIDAVLSTGTDYLWRVRIESNGVAGDWSDVSTFRLDIGSVTPAAPINSLHQNDRTPQFTWYANDAAASYNFVLSTSPTLATTLHSVTGVTVAGYTLPDANILPTTAATTYYWAVAPVDAHGVVGTRSTIASFVLDTEGPSPVAVLINGGAAETLSDFLVLDITASDPSGVAQMNISPYSSMLFGEWQPYSAHTTYQSVKWDFSNLYAYVKLRDSLGNETAFPAWDTIRFLRKTVGSILWDGAQCVGDNIWETQTWISYPYHYYADRDVVVDPLCTLTINPYQRVVFARDAKLVVKGTLIANAPNGASKITLTSEVPEEGAGTWGGVEFTPTAVGSSSGGAYVSGSILKNVVIENAGDPDALLVSGLPMRGAVHIEESAPYLEALTITGAGNSGVYAHYSAATTRELNLKSSAIDGIVSQVHEYSSRRAGGVNVVQDNTSGTLTANIEKNRISNNQGDAGGISLTLRNGTGNIQYNVITGNRAVDFYGGGVILPQVASAGSCAINLKHNQIDANSADTEGSTSGMGGGGYLVSDCTLQVDNNIIADNSSGQDSAFMMTGNNARAWYNAVIRNATSGSNTGVVRLTNYTTKVVSMQYSTFKENIYQSSRGEVDLSGDLDAGMTNFNYNNFFGSTNPRTVYVNGKSPVTPYPNWWNTTSTIVIDSRIYCVDTGVCSPSSFRTTYYTTPYTGAPIAPPGGFSALDAGGGGIDVAWTPVPESDRAGYRIYWATNPDGPFTKIDVAGGTSSGYYFSPAVSGTTYYFKMTAYDTTDASRTDDITTPVNEKQTFGNESWYTATQTVAVP